MSLQEGYDVQIMCNALGVSRRGYYDYCKRPPSARAVADELLTAHIKLIHERSDETYGYRRLQQQLAREQVRVNDKRVRRLMRLAGLQGYTPRLKRRIYQIAAEGVHAPDLVRRDWNPDLPNKLWVGDIERHEALTNRAVMKGHRGQLVAASW